MQPTRILSLFALSFLLSITARAQTSILTLGAKGDGLTDDTAAIQKAVDQNASLTFPKGTYKISKTIQIDLAKTGFAALSSDGTGRILMSGEGPAFHFTGTHEGTAAPSSVKADTWDKQRTPMVTGLEIVGANPKADGIEATGTLQITIARTVIRKCRHAIHLTTRNRNVLIADCHLYENSGIGIFYDDVNLHQSNIIGCHISYNDGGGIVSRGGNVRNVQIGTCDIEGNHSLNGGPPSANVELDSTGGSIGEVTVTGCTLQHTSKSPGSANIRINGAGNDPSLERRVGRPTTREGNVTITANVFSDVQTNIEIRESRGITITGNTFWEGFQHDLIAEGCEHLVIANNNFDRNPRYAVNGFNEAENNGIVLKNCADTAFTGNVISGVWRQRAAVDISDGNRLMISNNTILDSDGASLRLEKVTRSLISNNLIRDDRPAGKKSKEASLLIIGGDENEIGANSLGTK